MHQLYIFLIKIIIPTELTNGFLIIILISQIGFITEVLPRLMFLVFFVGHTYVWSFTTSLSTSITIMLQQVSALMVVWVVKLNIPPLNYGGIYACYERAFTFEQSVHDKIV